MWDGIQLDDHIMTVHPGSDFVSGVRADGDGGCEDVADGSTPGDGGGPLAGDNLEVWWDEESQWFPCVVTQQRPDSNSTTASCCRYDDSSEKLWHNLNDETWRRISPTKVRLGKLTIKHLRQRLRLEAVC